ncbi:hypothetical protein KFE25_010489 [Diacronema lutheri]|uniref:E2 ubiquitin-conjugating enzyme n=2 Tax=Diacronema lutheri TaxID=2081491 RepID=A0A8J6C422_DIALT|nr:hypothetical protein KFE25_010489 [Diacronema lutheri]
MAQAARLNKELAMLERDPPPGVSVWPKESKLTELEAVLAGPEGSPYESGLFRLDITLSARYPFEPPKVTFRTAIYHPNIDTAGRICLDTLNMPPKGAWKPSINIGTVLTSLRLLLAEPNADDPLMDDVAAQLRTDPAAFRRAAAEHTRVHARPTSAGGACAAPAAGAARLPSAACSTAPAVSVDAGPAGACASPDGACAAQAPHDATGSAEREQKRPRGEPSPSAAALTGARDSPAAAAPAVAKPQAHVHVGR